jgi:hypothetical protein
MDISPTKREQSHALHLTSHHQNRNSNLSNSTKSGIQEHRYDNRQCASARAKRNTDGVRGRRVVCCLCDVSHAAVDLLSDPRLRSKKGSPIADAAAARIFLLIKEAQLEGRTPPERERHKILAETIYI